jgi:flagellar hook assembly protein FlgD
MRDRCTIQVTGDDAEGTTVLVFDAQGRTVQLLRCREAESGRLEAGWDGRNAAGVRVRPGVYFMRSSGGTQEAAGKVLLLD